MSHCINNGLGCPDQMKITTNGAENCVFSSIYNGRGIIFRNLSLEVVKHTLSKKRLLNIYE